MISYGLKIYTSDKPELFSQAAELLAKQIFGFVELYHNPGALDFDKIGIIRDAQVMIHNTHNHGWHEFVLGVEQLAVWKKTKQLADYFKSPYIIVHPGRDHNLESFLENLQKIDDSRILIENMAGLDIQGQPMFAQTIEQLQQIHEHKPICFDFEKAGSAARYQSRPYQDYVSEALYLLKPSYFHVSGRLSIDPRDQHRNLWESDLDLSWIKRQLEAIAEEKELYLVFETPKENDLDNDLKNLDFFRNL